MGRGGAGYLQHPAVCKGLLLGHVGTRDLHILDHHLLLVPPLGGGEHDLARRPRPEEQELAEGGDEIVVQVGFLHDDVARPVVLWPVFRACMEHARLVLGLELSSTMELMIARLL